MSSWLRPYLVSCQLFTSVFGVGPKTADKWYRGGLRSFSDVLGDRGIRLNRMQQSGASTSYKNPLCHSTNYRLKTSTLVRFQEGFKDLNKVPPGGLSFSFHLGFLCLFRSLRRILMWGSICTCVPWRESSRVKNKRKKAVRVLFNKKSMNSDCERERLLWNSHELSSLAGQRQRRRRGRWLPVAELWFPSHILGLYFCGESPFIAFVILLLGLITDGFWINIFGQFPEQW